MIQLQVLNYILNTKDSSLIVLNNLNKDYFSEYKGEFIYIKRHLDTYGVVPDLETFIQAFPDFEIIDVKEPASYLIEELFKDYKSRQMAMTFNKVRTYLLNNDVESAMKVYREGADNLSTGIALQSVDILKDTSRYNDYLEKTQNFTKYYLTTGFKELDSVLGGIDRQEELGVIVARTNKGKSWILTKMAVEAARQGLNVGLYSGEMSENKVGYRVDTLLGHINCGSLMHGNSKIKDEYTEYIRTLPERNMGSLKVLTPKMINGSAGVNALRVFIEKENLDILFIDQLSLLEDDRKAKVPFEKASNISKDLKNLQVLKRIPIISVSQQNRTKNDDKDDDSIDTTQLAMSDRIAQDATFILGITRDKKDDTIMTIHVVKSRDSANGQRLNYCVDLSNGTFVYIPDENDAVQGTTEINYEDRYSVQPEESSVINSPTEDKDIQF